MKILIALPALALVGAAPPEQGQPADALEKAPRLSVDNVRSMIGQPRCDDLASTARRDYKPDEDAPVTVRNLNELPPAEGYYAVWRTDERGCPDPIKFDLPQKPRR